MQSASLMQLQRPIPVASVPARTACWSGKRMTCGPRRLAPRAAAKPDSGPAGSPSPKPASDVAPGHAALRTTCALLAPAGLVSCIAQQVSQVAAGPSRPGGAPVQLLTWCRVFLTA